MSYDVIVVGARVAGAATAMLLARRGLRVLAVDRVSFPSDTISSHQVQVPGVARLLRWGLLDAVHASGAPPTRRVRLDTPGAVLDGHFPAYQGVDALYSPRRTVLDALLVDAARAAGAEVREHFRVEELLWDGDRVTGIAGRERDRPLCTESAPLVVGADGKRSFVAQAAGAARYRERPVHAFACYGYWAGVPVTTGTMYQRPGLAVAVFPTNDDLTMVYLSAPIAGFEAFRADIESNYLKALDRCGDLGERVRAGTRAERLRTTPDQPNTFRRAHGPGWALVGDAGVVMDSISAQGITNALRDAESLADAISTDTLAEHQRRRDRAVRAMFDFTVRLATFPDRAADRLFLRAVAQRPAEAERLLGGFSGVLPVDEVFSTRSALRVLTTHAARRLFPPAHPPATPPEPAPTSK